MKKGQAELLGLVFIVLILVLSLLLYVRFSGQKEEIAFKIRSNTRVNNMLNALMLVSVDGEQMKDVLIRECGSTDCDIKYKELIEKLMLKMKEEREDYELSFEGAFTGLDKFGEGCEEGISATPARFRKEGTPYIVKLKLC